MDDDNGILFKIPAEFIGRALDLMPDPQSASPGDTASAVVTVRELGEVRITAVCKRDPRWLGHRFWSAVRADLA